LALREDVVDYCMTREERKKGSGKTTSQGRFGTKEEGVSSDMQAKTIEYRVSTISNYEKRLERIASICHHVTLASQTELGSP
jgi:hypothetical protein